MSPMARVHRRAAWLALGRPITPAVAAMDRSQPLSGTTSKKLASAGTYITSICNATTSRAIPASSGLVSTPILNRDSLLEREASA